MKSLSLKTKLWICCASLLSILLLVGGIAFKSALTTAALIQTVQFNVHKQSLASAMQLAVEKEKVGGRDALLKGDRVYLANARADFSKQMETLQPLLTSATSHQLYAQIQTSNSAYCGLVDKALQEHDAGDNTGALESFYGQAAAQTPADLKASTVALVDWYEKLATEAEAKQASSAQQASNLILALVLFGLVIGVTLSMSEEVGGMVAQIATAASQQQGATEQINSSVSQISNLTQASADNADQTANACVNLSALASGLQRLVTEFCVTSA
jgi:hypothetical protein